MNQKLISCFFVFIWSVVSIWGQYTDKRTRTYLAPKRIVWQNSNFIQNQNALLKQGNGQSMLTNRDLCVLKSTAEQSLSF